MNTNIFESADILVDKLALDTFRKLGISLIDIIGDFDYSVARTGDFSYDYYLNRKRLFSIKNVVKKKVGDDFVEFTVTFEVDIPEENEKHYKGMDADCATCWYNNDPCRLIECEDCPLYILGKDKCLCDTIDYGAECPHYNKFVKGE